MKHIKITFMLFLFSFVVLYGQTPEEIEIIKEQSNIAELNTLQSRYNSEFELQKRNALEYAATQGWEIFIENEDGSISELVGMTADRTPIYYKTSNVNASKSSRANHLNSGGSLGLSLNGQSMTAYVWDGGPVRTSHQEYGSRVMVGDGVTTLNGNSFHSTHVTGTISAAGVVPAAKGMAYQSNSITHDWSNDLSEATAAAGNGMLLSNHSYGAHPLFLPDWQFGAYTTTSRNWDNVMYNAPFYLMVKAAGNDGQNNSYNGNPLNGNSVYDKLGPRAAAKNGLVVAATNDANVNTNGDLISVSIASFSSQGPTDDLRIKPDIAGNGVSVYSTFDNSNTAYNSISGTSMATPSVTGSLLLLQQHYKSLNPNFMKAATLKGLVLHTSDDAGSSGPDVIFGWGLMNTKRAAETITDANTSSIIEENTLTSGAVYSTTVTSDGVNPLIASISWTDPAGTANTGTANLTTPVLVNDLDIRITKGGSTYSPYKLTSITTNTTGDNTVDPYERIDVNGASGTYTITITHKGTLSSNQNYSLIVTGIATASCPPNLVVSTDVTSGIDNKEADLTITATNSIFASAEATYHAGEEVLLQDGFDALTSSKFRAYIEGCSGMFVNRLPENTERPIVRYKTNNTAIADEDTSIMNLSNGFEAYPNPTRGLLNIQLNNNSIQNLEVYNISGSMVYSKIISQKDLSQYQLDLSRLQAGIYIIKVRDTKGELFVNRIIKQ